VFYLGAAAAAVLLPATYWLVPESVPWLLRGQPLGALERANRSLSALGHRALTALPELPSESRKASLPALFSPAYAATTVLVAGAFLAHFLSFYYLLKWAPKIAADMGFPASAGGRILTMANFGGVAGGLLFGAFAVRAGLKPLSIGVLLLNALAIVGFGRAGRLEALTWAGVFVGFLGNAAVSGLFSLAAYAFPADLRATGTGFVIGAGRGGAIVSPWIAGYLFQTGIVPQTVALTMAVGSVVAAVALYFACSPSMYFVRFPTRIRPRS
jgi:predicted MFS family arabinose efflux permease